MLIDRHRRVGRKHRMVLSWNDFLVLGGVIGNAGSRSGSTRGQSPRVLEWGGTLDNAIGFVKLPGPMGACCGPISWWRE